MPPPLKPAVPCEHATFAVASWYACAIAIVLFGGALNILFPFVSDQVVALLGARTIAEGGTLYVDYWDNKLPGLIWFHYVAGELFGYSERGVHTLDVIWMTVFSLVMLATLRRYVAYPWLAALAPVAVAGMYYFSVEPLHLTQLEMLVALPIFVSAWLSARGLGERDLSPLWFFGAGIFAGVTVTFKLVFAPLFVAFWVVVSADALLRTHASITQLIRRLWLPVTAGVVLVLSLVAGKFWWDNALGELLWTAFVYPPQALAEAPPATLLRLAESVMYFATYSAVWFSFIIVAAIQWWREDRNLLTSLLFTWLVLGFALILIQRFSWWQYHFLNLFAPAGILGVRGFSDVIRMLARESTSRFSAPMLLSLVLAAPLVGSLAVPAGQKVRAYVKVFITDGGDTTDFMRTVSEDYAGIQHSVRFLNDKTALPGNIYIFGDPLYYYLSGRRQALPMGGSAWIYFLGSQWLQLPGQLAETRPPYIYINDYNRKLIDYRADAVQAFIAKRYLALLKDYNGVWYILKPDYRR